LIKLLLADDEQPLLNFLTKGLCAEGYHCACVNVLHDVIPTIRKYQPDIIVLDRLFKDEDSLDLMQAIKALPNAPLVLMLTALDEVSERVKGLQEGADDYLCKPFDFDELIARISALGRRISNQTNSDSVATKIGSLEILHEQRIARLNGLELSLTKIEYELLTYLIKNQGKVMSRERILNRVWQTQNDPQTNVIDVYISKLRKKLEGDPQIAIQTLRGNGYRLSIDAKMH
jgi:two-component system response regulator PrrA